MAGQRQGQRVNCTHNSESPHQRSVPFPLREGANDRQEAKGWLKSVWAHIVQKYNLLQRGAIGHFAAVAR